MSGLMGMQMDRMPMVEDFMRVTHRRVDRDLVEVLVGDARESVRKC